ncbi:ethylene-insensitive protein 2.2 isoform X2 [Cryptomeria japonica]|uniref:ethylene-insensitive protein 2.2 isoform X2 n=1 Tax=Cryptomeria japonica TaxID=3369 RepID=UPI0025AC5887|nr:ethylene-insensitive protein 2.2 isoform X2 [Cryptomeria japonica]
MRLRDWDVYPVLETSPKCPNAQGSPGHRLQSLPTRNSRLPPKNLGCKICAEEYPRPVCLLLWLQCEASVLVLNLTMILGTATGFNLLLDMDMRVCVILSTVDVFLFPILFPHLGKRRAEVLAVIIAGLMLIFSVLDSISTEQNVAFIMNGLLPTVRRESLYMAVGLLGANIMPHNFYLHSSVVQEQKLETIPIGTLCHYNLLEIGIALSGILLVNLALLSSAATTFHNAGLEVLTYQDAQPLIEQVFKSPIPLVAFFIGIYCASQLSTLTGTVGAQVALEGFLGVHPRIWVHRTLIKVGAVVLAMLCIWNTEAAGIYWLLIFSQVMLAMQLPSAVIPLFRVASSSSIMGNHKVSFAVEVMAWLSFFFMLILNLSLVLEMCFWDSDWMCSLRWNIGTGRAVPFTLVLMVAGMSFGLMLWLITMPLKSANEKPEIQPPNDEPITLHKHSEHLILKHTDTEGTKSEDVSLALELSVNKEVISDKPLAETNFRICSEENVVPIASSVQEGRSSSSEHVPNTDLLQPVDAKSDTELSPDSSASSNSVGIESSSMKMPGTTSDSLSTNILSNVVKSSTEASEMSTFKEVEMEADIELEKDDDDDVWEHEDVLMDISESVSSVTYEEPGSGRSVGGRSDDGGSGNGSLSRLSGLGRAARRQFASILDEFWGKLFDFHGKPTKQAILKRLDLALGMKAIQPRENVIAREPNYFREQQRMLWQKGNTSECSSHAESCMQTGEHLSGLHSSMGTNMHGVSSASWLSSTLSQDPYTSQAIPSFSLSERRYSSLHLPAHREEFDYQPATIHGYQMASYMGRSGTLMEGDNTIGSRIESQAHAGSRYPTCIDNSMNNVAVGSGIDELWGSGFQNTGYKSHALQGGQSSYDKSISSRSLLRSHENSPQTGQTKKYHSLPDIYGCGISQCNPLIGQKTDQWNPLVKRVTGELDMRYGLGCPSPRRGFMQTPVSRTATFNDRKDSWDRQTPLAFDELSPSQLHKDAFSLQSNSNAENSLWSRQPFEQLFGMPGTGSKGLHYSDRSGNTRNISSRTIPCVDSEVEMLQSLRFCIAKLLRLDGSEWLFGFRQNGGLDEELIGLVAFREQFLHDADASESYRLYNNDAQNQRQNHKYGSTSGSESSVPNCGEGCIWESGLVVSFGVWCIHRILELSLMESRPELWGKYTYVLNRLQGILDIAFFKPRHVLPLCFCLDIPSPADISGRKMGSVGLFSNGVSATTCQSISQMRSGNVKGKGASASVFLEIIKDVESAVASRKGRTGTAAGDVAFPKGKENLASVLKRYKRRLANKQGMLENNSGSRKAF